MDYLPRAQSAMEYLMTYGWAILIILIVLAVLYTIGVFNPNSVLGTQCNVKFHYSCTNLALATNGTVSLLLGQNTGSIEYNIAVACTAAANSSGEPLAGTSPWIYLNKSGAGTGSYSASSSYTLGSGKSVPISNMPCYSDTGAALGSQPIGTQFSGILWIRYTDAPGSEGGLNGWITQQIATPYVPVSSSGKGTASASTTVQGNTRSSTSSTTTSSTSTTTVPGTYASSGVSNITDTSLAAPSLANAYSQYICAGGDDGTGVISTNWAGDVEDPSYYTSVGRSSSNCAITSGQAPLSISEVALNGAPTPSSVVTNYTGKYPISVTFSVTSNNSFVAIFGACSAGQNVCSGLSLPSGCTEIQNNAGGGGVFSGAAVCSMQPGNYTAQVVQTGAIKACAISKVISPPCDATASIAAYVFPSYNPTLST